MKPYILAILVLLSLTTAAQEPDLKLTVLGGSSVPLHVNSLKKWDEGVTLEGWTRLRIRFNDTNTPPVSTGWRLLLSAEKEGIEYDGSGVDMDLSILEIKVDEVQILSGNIYGGGGILTLTPLSSTQTELLMDNQIHDVDLLVTISYELGVGSVKRLSEYTSGYYLVNLIYTLEQIE